MASTADHSLSVHSETVDTKGCVSLETAITKRELEAVENALLRILQEENPLTTPSHELRKAELSRRLSDGADSENSDASLKGGENELDSKDLKLLSKLLNQVQHFNMEQKRDDLSSGEFSPVENRKFQKLHRNSKHPHVAEESALSQSEKMVENVVSVASAAAEAAKAAAATATKNVEIMESLLGNSKKLNVHHEKTNDSETSQEDFSNASGIDERAKKLVKGVEKQNRITHWMLGISMVATFIWRFKVFSMAVDARNTITNPFQAFGGIFDGGSNKEESNGAKPLAKARTVIPSLLQERNNEKNRKMNKATSEDAKLAEGLSHSLDNMLSGGNPFSNGNNSSEQSEQ